MLKRHIKKMKQDVNSVLKQMNLEKRKAILHSYKAFNSDAVTQLYQGSKNEKLVRAFVEQNTGDSKNTLPNDQDLRNSDCKVMSSPNPNPLKS